MSATVNVEALRHTVTDMDCLAHGGFSEIAAIARLALRLLETPRGHSGGGYDDIAKALEVIENRAVDADNAVNSLAEHVGCHYVDTAMGSRMDARHAATQASAGVEG